MPQISRILDKPRQQRVVDNWAMAKKRISELDGRAYLGDLPDSKDMAVRFLLQVLEDKHPGGTIELRVPPFGAVQLVGGMNHRRGTPPNVVELDPDSFLDLVFGLVSWEDLGLGGKLLASGSRAHELRDLFPLDEF